jgi:hypothetical protein
MDKLSFSTNQIAKIFCVKYIDGYNVKDQHYTTNIEGDGVGPP